MTTLSTRLAFAPLIARAVLAQELLARSDFVPRGVCVMSLVPCDFGLMPVPSFEEFAKAYPVAIRNEADARERWNNHGPQDRKRAVFYIPYLQSYSGDHNLPLMRPELWLLLGWWKWIPDPIQRRIEAPVKASPSLVPAMGADAHA